MGYDDNGILKIDQEFFQPGDGIQVQVVGWLVQKQNIRISKQCLCQQDFYSLRSGQIFDRFSVKFRINSKTV